MDIQPDGKEAVLGLINSYHEDNDFTSEESNDFKAVWDKCEGGLSENSDDYRDICYEVGKLYWYYYSYGITEDNQDNQSTKMKAARPWFEIVLDNSDESYSDYDLARVYKSIGDFYANIQTASYEAEDSGMYSTYWQDLSELITLNSVENSDKEIVKLEMYKLVINSIENYAVKFGSDGIEREELKRVLDNITEKICVSDSGETISLEEILNSDVEDGDKLKILKREIAERISFAERAIETAYK